MKLIVGLGNPGVKYAGTRHNAGRLAVEGIARKGALQFSNKAQFKASFAQGCFEGQNVILAYPEIFMNTSGEAVSSLLKHFNVHPENELLIIMDEVALPFGALRLRAHGSSGGHNGLKSVEAAIGTLNYARLRMGIGNVDSANTGRPQGNIPLEDFVLMPFSGEEKKNLTDFLTRTEQACHAWIKHPIAEAMNIVNHSF